MAVPVYDHIVVVVMENHDYGQIIGAAGDAPYLNSLAAHGALLSNYRGITHPSEPNYLALYAGSTFGVSDDRTHNIAGPTLATILQGAGKTFVGYVERRGRSQDHNPWEAFPEGRAVEKDFATFPRDKFASLPTVSFVIPGVHHDMHDGTVSQGDQWLKANIGGYADWATSHNSLLVVTWDESASDGDNHVPAILYGAHVATGIYPEAYNHYNLLSTVLAASNLSGPRSAAAATPVQVFTPAPGSGKTISGSVAGPITLGHPNSPLSITGSGTITSTGQDVDGVNGQSEEGLVVMNDGTIVSSAGLGVALAGNGTIVNGPTRAGGASITGAGAGVRIERRPSSVTNSGKISATGTGVDLRDGGAVTNHATAALHGDQFGLFITGGPGTVANAGKISGGERIGVDLAQGGRIDNAANGVIAGKVAGVFFAGGEAALTNAGHINATGAAGVDIESGGNANNERGASIVGADFGIFVAGRAGTVTNQGTIAGKDKFGVDLTVGGSVVNLQSAAISSTGTGIGVYGGQGKVTNHGTISGDTAAIRFSGNGNLLVAKPTAVFSGSVVGGTTVGNTLELAGGTGTIAGQGEATGSVIMNGHSWPFSNFDVLKIDQGGIWALNSSAGAQTIINSGTITVSGNVHVPTMLSSQDYGLYQIAPSAELRVTSAVGDKARIRFQGDGRLVLDAPDMFGADVGKPSYSGPQLEGFHAGDVVVLSRFPPSKVILSYDPSVGILMISNGERAATLAFRGAMPAGEVFKAVADGAEGTAITRKRSR
ncbi:MAG: hypothetical protein J0H14_12350 [Alphaproteobacteria bacterium]|nr:hypothetical protein [Alphaproteobacteria bacterium]